LCVCEEVSSFDEKTYHAVKHLIAGENITSEKKGRQPHSIINITNYIFVTNKDNIFTGAKEDRRFTFYRFNSKWGSVQKPNDNYVEEIKILRDFAKGRYIEELRTFFLEYEIDKKILAAGYNDEIKQEITNMDSRKLSKIHLHENFDYSYVVSKNDRETMINSRLTLRKLQRIKAVKKVNELFSKINPNFNTMELKYKETDEVFFGKYSLITLSSFKRLVTDIEKEKVDIDRLKQWAIQRNIYISANNNSLILVHTSDEVDENGKIIEDEDNDEVKDTNDIPQNEVILEGEVLI